MKLYSKNKKYQAFSLTYKKEKISIASPYMNPPSCLQPSPFPDSDSRVSNLVLNFLMKNLISFFVVFYGSA